MASGASKGTTWQPLVDLLIARRINQVLGPLIGPWDVPQLDEVTVDLVLGYTGDYSTMQQGFAKIESIKQKIRQSHPTYKKRAERIH